MKLGKFINARNILHALLFGALVYVLRLDGAHWLSILPLPYGLMMWSVGYSDGYAEGILKRPKG